MFVSVFNTLRKRVETDIENFFVTATGGPVKKLYQDLNRILGKKNIGTVSATTFRKIIETAGRQHDCNTEKNLAGALQHSVDTATRHYVVKGPQEAIKRQNVIDKVQQTAMADQYIKEK